MPRHPAAGLGRLAKRCDEIPVSSVSEKCNAAFQIETDRGFWAAFVSPSESPQQRQRLNTNLCYFDSFGLGFTDVGRRLTNPNNRLLWGTPVQDMG